MSKINKKMEKKIAADAKKLFDFLTHMHQWSGKLAERIPCLRRLDKRNTEGVERIVERIEKLLETEKAGGDITTNIIRELYTTIERVKDDSMGYRDYLRSVLSHLQGQSQEAVAKQMVHGVETWETFFRQMKGEEKLVVREGTLYIYLPVPRFSLSYKGLRDVSFENLVILMKLHPAQLRILYEIQRKRGQKVHKGCSTQKHPHTRGNGLCTGEGGHIVETAMRRGDIIGLYVLLVRILRTYNHPGVFQKLANFTAEKGGRCSNFTCERWITLSRITKMGDTSKCSHCKKVFCPDCQKKFKALPSSTASCAICKETKNKTGNKEPKGKLCENCYLMLKGKDYRKCGTCGETTCHRHIHKCSDCNTYQCEKCGKKCPIYGEWPCSNHLAKDKIKAEYGICNYCERNYPGMVDAFLENKEKEKGVVPNEVS